MKKTRISILALFATIILVGCSNNQDKALQQNNDLLQQQNTLLQQPVNQQDTNTASDSNAPGYVTNGTTTTGDTTTTSDSNPDNTKTIPFNALQLNTPKGFYGQ